MCEKGRKTLTFWLFIVFLSARQLWSIRLCLFSVNQSLVNLCQIRSIAHLNLVTFVVKDISNTQFVRFQLIRFFLNGHEFKFELRKNIERTKNRFVLVAI